MPKCKGCDATVPTRKFIDGKQRTLNHRKYCLDCSPFRKVVKQNSTNGAAVIKWRQRKKLLAVHYKGGECQRCGYSKCAQALIFHHRDPAEKDFTISGVSWSWDRIKNELDKCDLLCSNCHIELHSELQGNSEPLEVQINEVLELQNKQEQSKKVLAPCLLCRTPTTNKKYCSFKCSTDDKIITPPPKETLLELKTRLSYSKIAKLYGVGHVLVAKWFRNIPR